MAYPSAVATNAELHVAVNNLATTLAAAIDGTQTTGIILTSSTGFPTAGFVTIESEVISYTGISVNELTGVTRGADGTPQASHAISLPVNHYVVAAHHNDLKDELINVETELFSRIDATVASTIQTKVSIRGVDGSAGAPMYGFIDETDMGMFSPAANVLAWSTQGVERMRVDANGRVGIGLTPGTTAELQVAGDVLIASGASTPFTAQAGGDDLGLSGGSPSILIEDTGAPSGEKVLQIIAPGTGLFNVRSLNDAGSGVVAEAMRWKASNGQTQFNDGSAANAGIGFINDDDTGIYRSASDEGRLSAGGVDSVGWNDSVTATETRLKVYDVDNAALETVTVGVADSGGAGFKVLRIPN